MLWLTLIMLQHVYATPKNTSFYVRSNEGNIPNMNDLGCLQLSISLLCSTKVLKPKPINLLKRTSIFIKPIHLYPFHGESQAIYGGIDGGLEIWIYHYTVHDPDLCAIGLRSLGHSSFGFTSRILHQIISFAVNCRVLPKRRVWQINTNHNKRNWGTNSNDLPCTVLLNIELQPVYPDGDPVFNGNLDIICKKCPLTYLRCSSCFLLLAALPLGQPRCEWTELRLPSAFENRKCRSYAPKHPSWSGALSTCQNFPSK